MPELTRKTGFSWSERWYNPIRTRRRRLFVVVMWTLMLSSSLGDLIVVIRNRPLYWQDALTPLVWLLFFPAWTLGGLRYGGPVKKFENPRPDSQAGYELWRAMNPTVYKKAGMPAWANDEFDLERRNQAHYSAYRILRWIYPALAGAVWVLCRNPVTAKWAVPVLEASLLPSIIAFLWLPQTIILWREEDTTDEAGPKLVTASDLHS
jgi:hypothetical protein